MEAPIRARRTLAVRLFALLFFLARSSPLHHLLIFKVERRIDLSSDIVISLLDFEGQECW